MSWELPKQYGRFYRKIATEHDRLKTHAHKTKTLNCPRTVLLPHRRWVISMQNSQRATCGPAAALTHTESVITSLIVEHTRTHVHTHTNANTVRRDPDPDRCVRLIE